MPNRLYVFSFVNADPTTDQDGFDVVPSFAITAPSLDEAVAKLAAHCHGTLGWSDHPSDYKDDIENGNIDVHVPAVV